MTDPVATFNLLSCTHPTIEGEQAIFEFSTDGAAAWELKVWKASGSLFWVGERTAGSNAINEANASGSYARIDGAAGKPFWVVDFTCSPSSSSVSSFSSVSSLSSVPIVDCGDACAKYLISLVGGSTLDGAAELTRVGTSCRWQSASNTAWLSEVGGLWQLVVTSATALVVFNGNGASSPPSTSPADWTRIAYTDTADGSPEIDFISTFSCDGSDAPSSSSAVVVGCDFERNAAGGNAGFNDLYDISAAFEGDPTGSRVFYFTYQTYDVPDRFLITSADGAVVHHDSGCVGTLEPTTVPVALTLADGPIRVQIVPNCAGTDDTGWYWRCRCEPEALSSASSRSLSSASSQSLSSGSSQTSASSSSGLCCETYSAHVTHESYDGLRLNLSFVLSWGLTPFGDDGYVGLTDDEQYEAVMELFDDINHRWWFRLFDQYGEIGWWTASGACPPATAWVPQIPPQFDPSIRTVALQCVGNG